MDLSLPKNPASGIADLFSFEMILSTALVFVVAFGAWFAFAPLLPSNSENLLYYSPQKAVAFGGFVALAYVGYWVARKRWSIGQIGVQPTVSAILERPMDHSNYLEEVVDEIDEAELLQLAQAMAKGNKEAQNIALEILVPAYDVKVKARKEEEALQTQRAKTLEDLIEGRSLYADEPSSSSPAERS